MSQRPALPMRSAGEYSGELRVLAHVSNTVGGFEGVANVIASDAHQATAVSALCPWRPTSGARSGSVETSAWLPLRLSPEPVSPGHQFGRWRSGASDDLLRVADPGLPG